MKKFNYLPLFVVAFVMMIALTISTEQTANAQGGNYLTNPSFEGAYSDFIPLVDYQKDACKLGVCTTAQMPGGWLPFWKPQTDADPDWRNRMPEYKPVCPYEPCPFTERLKDGAQALQYFTFFGTHEAGVFQKVDNIPANQALRFSVWGLAWSTNDDSPTSDFPSPVNMRIGIDPTGGTNPYSPSVIWSGFANPYDAYQPFEVTAQAQGTTVTVFMWSAPTEQRKHNDIYWDGASLTNFDGTVSVVAPAAGEGGEGGDAPAAPVVDPSVRFASGPTPTPNAEGLILVEVLPGDTLWSIAARAGISLDQVLTFNNLTASSFINPGQFLVIGDGSPSAAPTPEPEEAAAEEEAPAAEEAAAEEASAVEEVAQVVEEPTPVPTPVEVVAEVVEPEAIGASVCLRAFTDANADGFYSPDEQLAKGVAITIAKDQTMVSNYITTGESEPYCIEGLDAGNYRISRSFVTNEVATTGSDWAVVLVDGALIDIDFGSRIDEAAVQATEVAASAMTNTSNDGASTDAGIASESSEQIAAASADSGSNLYAWLIWIIVAIAVVLIIGVALVVFSASRTSIE